MLSDVLETLYNVVLYEQFGCSCCLVYRLGGETLDVTVVQVNAGMYTICGTMHRSNLGGNMFTRILADYLASEFRQ
jgi:molecular chaperone DnaK (HSP70)